MYTLYGYGNAKGNSLILIEKLTLASSGMLHSWTYVVLNLEVEVEADSM